MELRSTSPAVDLPPVMCNGCLTLMDPAWEPVSRIGEFSFHPRCAPRCSMCGRSLESGARGEATEFYVLDSRVEFVSSRGYQVALTVCCCDTCYLQAIRDEPSALA